MKKLKNGILILWVLLVLQGSAQDFPYHYFSHSVPVITNPSLVAATSDISASVGTYNLWAGGFNPVNDYLVSLAVSPDFFRRRSSNRNNTRIGLGLNLLNDRIGPFNQYTMQLIYAYHIPLSRDVQLSLGVSGIIENLNIDINSLTPGFPDDPRLMSGNNLSFMFDGGFGASILAEDFVLGLSILNLAPGSFRFTDEPAADFSSYRKIFLNGMYQYSFSQHISIRPMMTLRNSRFKWLNYDASVDFGLQYFDLGVGYRSENIFFLFVQIPFRSFSITYTSENPLQSNHMTGNGHSFTFGWNPGELIR